jgi:hypothetical protein
LAFWAAFPASGFILVNGILVRHQRKEVSMLSSIACTWPEAEDKDMAFAQSLRRASACVR